MSTDEKRLICGRRRWLSRGGCREKSSRSRLGTASRSKGRQVLILESVDNPANASRCLLFAFVAMKFGE